MAQVVYQSSQSAGNSGSSVVITKPSSLAVGDLMIAQILGTANSSPTVNTPTGWALIRSDTASDGTSAIRASSFWKVADSADVAASNFTFSGTVTAIAGAIARFTSTNLTSPVDQNNGSTQTVVTALSTSGITPTKDTGTFLIFTYSSDNKNITVSGYAIATQNPSWTEAYDATFSDIGPGSRELTISMAYGSRNTLTATGNATATLSSSMALACTQITNIVPADLVSITGTFSMPGAGILIDYGTPLALVSTLGTAAVTIVTNKWRNVSKNVSDWINTQKS